MLVLFLEIQMNYSWMINKRPTDFLGCLCLRPCQIANRFLGWRIRAASFKLIFIIIKSYKTSTF